MPCRDWLSPWGLSTGSSHKLLTSAWEVVIFHLFRNFSLCVHFLIEKAIADFVQCFILQTKPLTYKTGHSLPKEWAATWFWHSAVHVLQWILFTLCTTAAPRNPDWWQSTHYVKKSHYFPKSSTYAGTTKETKMQFSPFKDEDQMQIWNTRSGPGKNWRSSFLLHLIIPNHSLCSKIVFVLQAWKSENNFKYPICIYLLHNLLDSSAMNCSNSTHSQNMFQSSKPHVRHILAVINQGTDLFRGDEHWSKSTCLFGTQILQKSQIETSDRTVKESMRNCSVHIIEKLWYPESGIGNSQ